MFLGDFQGVEIVPCQIQGDFQGVDCTMSFLPQFVVRQEPA